MASQISRSPRKPFRPTPTSATVSTVSRVAPLICSTNILAYTESVSTSSVLSFVHPNPVLSLSPFSLFRSSGQSMMSNFFRFGAFLLLLLSFLVLFFSFPDPVKGFKRRAAPLAISADPAAARPMKGLKPRAVELPPALPAPWCLPTLFWTMRLSVSAWD